MKVFRSLDEVLISRATAVTVGKFRIFHRGHRALLDSLFSFPEDSTVILIEDSGPRMFSEKETVSFFRTLKIKNLILLSYSEIKNISAKAFLDFLIRKVCMKRLIVGKDFHFGKGRTGDIRYLENNLKKGYELFVPGDFPSSEYRISANQIEALLKDGKIQKAAKLCGYPYYFTGVSVKGKQLGRKLGFPTVNLKVDSGKLLPRFGVYYGTLESSSGKWDAIINLGTNPTVTETNDVWLESHVLEGKVSLRYHRKIKVTLLRFIREERKFSNEADLKKQIKKDCEKVRRFREKEKSHV